MRRSWVLSVELHFELSRNNGFGLWSRAPQESRTLQTKENGAHLPRQMVGIGGDSGGGVGCW